MPGTLDNVRLILVRTRKPGNVGAVARLMANLGASDLWLVAPRCDHLSPEAKRQSTRGEPLLHKARVVADLPGALNDVTYAVASSCRGGLYREQIELSPRQMVEAARSRRAGGRIALVFGPEDTGLRTEEILACDAVVRIPTDPAYPSLNLAQAVAICTYEMHVAAVSQPEVTPPFLGAGPAEPADAATIAQLMTRLETALLRIGYLRPEHPEHLLFPIRAVLSRAGLSRTEARILIGLAQQILEYADGR